MNGQQMLIAMVIENLISNADKYSPPEATIEISLGTNDEGEVEITVSDHGIGIDESELPELFTPFYRAGMAKEYASGSWRCTVAASGRLHDAMEVLTLPSIFRRTACGSTKIR
jgi:light-regulated signal transduction histidine kinase (bacteriophytochrome)